MIGKLKNAKIALTLGEREVRSSRNKLLPPGWRFLGEGISRKVYLGPDNIAYKVSVGDGYSNKKEFKAAEHYRIKKDLPFVIPNTTLYLDGKVLAMDFVERSKTKRWNYECGCSFKDNPKCDKLRCYYRMEREFTTHTNLIDFHPGNCMIGKDGRYYVVDLAI